MKTRYFSFVQSLYPNLADRSVELISDNLLSPFHVELPHSLLHQAQSLIQTLYQLRETQAYQTHVSAEAPLSAKKNPGNKSLCMSYDFHLDSEGCLKLIEVNTNASFLLMSYFLYQVRDLSQPISYFSLNELNQNFLEEHSLHQSNNQKFHQNQWTQKTDDPLKPKKHLSIAIIDEAPQLQKLYFEFLLYQQFLQSFGHTVVIADPTELALTPEGQITLQGFSHSPIDFVYNRTTDFYLEDFTTQTLAMAYQNNSLTLSPNPHEYSLLADKKRLIEWSLALETEAQRTLDINTPSIGEQLKLHKNHFLKAILLTEENKDFIWSNKKKFFIKPLSSFGSKGSYRGEGISRTLFNQLVGKNFLAQEFCPAPEHVFTAKNIEPTKLKYDLRFYAYKNQVQSVVARLYQGQLTNLKTPHGGFAPVIFK